MSEPARPFVCSKPSISVSAQISARHWTGFLRLSLVTGPVALPPGASWRRVLFASREVLAYTGRASFFVDSLPPPFHDSVSQATIFYDPNSAVERLSGRVGDLLDRSPRDRLPVAANGCGRTPHCQRGKITLALMPPKPNPLETACSIVMRLASPGSLPLFRPRRADDRLPIWWRSHGCFRSCAHSVANTARASSDGFSTAEKWPVFLGVTICEAGIGDRVRWRSLGRDQSLSP